VAAKQKKKPTLKTIAYMTGLAVTTVSKALKDAPDIKDSTKARVKLIAKEIGYRPDRAGQRLRTGKTNVISLVLDTSEEVTSMTNDFLTGINNALKGTEYNLVLTPYVDDPLSPVQKIADTHGADGIILSSVKLVDERIAYLDKAGLPFATHGRSNMGIEHAYYDYDSAMFGNEAVQLLAKQGCERVSMVFPEMHFTYAQHLHEGFMKGSNDAGIDSHAVSQISASDSLDNIVKHTASLLAQNNRPDGFVCMSVNTAIAAIGGIEKAGLVVGKDVQVVAKQSRTNLLKWFGKNIYDFEENFIDAGYGVASSLLNIIDGQSVSKNQTVVFPSNWGQSVLR